MKWYPFFLTSLGKIFNDPDHSVDEDRFILIGSSFKTNFFFVVHVHIEDSDVLRIINWKATRREIQDFESLWGWFYARKEYDLKKNEYETESLFKEIQKKKASLFVLIRMSLSISSY